MRFKTSATCVLGVILFPAVGLIVGCEPEMPAPPPKVFGSTAEEDFDWAMQRMEHAMEMFRVSGGGGLSTKRELDYELIPPSEEQRKFTARVTISTRTVYQADTGSAEAERRRAEAKKESSKIKLDNPFKIPGDDTLEPDGVPVPDVPLAELDNPDIANPRVSTQKLEEKKDYLLEYADGQWQLESKDLEKTEQMWFDYALEQGEFAPGAAANN